MISEPAWLTNVSPGLERFWHPVALSAAVGSDTPTRADLLGRRWVLVRNGNSISAFADECPHRRASLSSGCIIDGTIQCAYHGWQFDLEGRCVKIPALGDGATIPPRSHLTAPFGVREHAGLVWIAVAEPETDPLQWPEWEHEGWDAWYLDVRSSSASAGLLTENFLDSTHFAFVHRNTFGSNSPSCGVETSDRNGWTLTGGYPQLTYQPGLGDVRAYVTIRLHGPFSVHITIASTTGTRVFTFFLQPCSADETRLYLGVACDDTGGDPNRIAAESAFNNRVYDEDLTILEDFFDQRLPLDLRAEVHTQADSHLVKYRRLLGDIVEQGRSA